MVLSMRCAVPGKYPLLGCNFTAAMGIDTLTMKVERVHGISRQDHDEGLVPSIAIIAGIMKPRILPSALCGSAC